MKLNSSVAAVLLASAVTVSGFGTVGNMASNASPVKSIGSSKITTNNKEKMLNEIYTSVGKTFDIKLEENSSTGYSWSYVTDKESIDLVSEKSEIQKIDQSEVDETPVGVPSDKTWTFKASKPGTYKLKFSYAQQWDKRAKPAKTVEYTIKVTENESNKPDNR
ncbi:protease inhibitor I42 family protein [Paenibacillus zanthoxyli]|uniref:protease inhibitor I42 family protein n=1 Tax=Paenibacillus zanthoxyli TaxID=369399 RepID=UPI00046FA6B3|nr:protease inhibitor I42 family protein [Paenibacillus zanthoxyli]